MEESKARFKSKWNRVFKEKEEHEQNPKHTNSFKLDDDVTAFLKPSTDKAAAIAAGTRPKLDIAIAQRWPSAQEVRNASAGGGVEGGEDTPNGFRKPRRRKGLKVGFVGSEPVVIGEGGEECEEPPSEVGRRRVVLGRSVSDRRAVDGLGWGRRQSGQSGEEERDAEFVPGPLKRANTSHDEVSVPLQKKVSPPLDDPVPARFTLSRTATGLGSQEEELALDGAGHVRQGSTSAAPPKIDTTFAWEQKTGGPLSSASSVYSAGSKDPLALAVRKRELRSNEGMTLRRASTLLSHGHEIEDEQQKRLSLGFGVAPSDHQYETLSRPDAPELLPEAPPAAITPKSAKSPLGPSPFDDPKYIKRTSRETTPDEIRQADPRQQRQAYQLSYMRAAVQQQPTQPQPRSAQPPALPHRPQQPPQQQPNYQPRPPIPAVPQVSPPSDMPSTQQAGFTGAAPKLPPRTSSPYRPPPAPSESRAEPQQQARSRDASPFRERIFNASSAGQAARQMYSRPNGSNGSLNDFSPSPKQSHSRSSSWDAQSPYSDPPTGVSQPLPTRFGAYNQSPQSASPRSSMIGRSPSSQQPPQASAPADYLPQQRAQQPTGLRPPGGGFSAEDPSSRPVSASSNRSFSLPMAPPARPSQTNAAASLSEDPRKPSVSSIAYGAQPSPQSAGSDRATAQFSAARPANPYLRQEDARRPGSADGSPATSRPMISPQSTHEGNPAADEAYAGFSARVAHMKGVFKLTAQKERPAERCTPQTWLRTALWWYLRGKAGLEVLLQQNRPRDQDGQIRELLTQPHVDLAKTWWILGDPLGMGDGSADNSPQSATSISGGQEMTLRQSIVMLQNHIKALSLSMSRNQLMPPPQSLIQGQDTTIWLEYPRFSADAAIVLGGISGRSPVADQSQPGLSPLDALPLGDSPSMHCYGRFPVEASMSTDDAGSERVAMQCILSMLRGKRDFPTTIVIASQNELVNVRIAPRHNNEKGLSWHDVSWKASSHGMVVRLPRGYDLMVRMAEKDFRSLWNLVEYARKVEHAFRPGENEKLVHETRLTELQYADSSNSNIFPPDKVKSAVVVLFERTEPNNEGGAERKLHRGYRLLLVTDPKHKSLASASHEVCRKGPLLFEFITDSAAHGMAAMVVRVREEARQCRILLVFSNVGSRQHFYDVLNGLTVDAHEEIVGKMDLASLNIEPAAQVEGFLQQAHPALQTLQWQKLGITNGATDENQSSHSSKLINSESLRIIARHATGCITDRLNLAKGELLVRLPCTETPAIQVLRSPQEDMTMSIDTRQNPAHVLDGISELLRNVHTSSTIRTFTFPTFDDLHAFQTAITGNTVRYDGLAATLSIARRRMVVPIYKKWEAATVRVQLVAHSTVVQFLAFMEGFSHADALCFQIKSMDTFEIVKGDAKGKKWAVKLVDAKFSLPEQEGKDVSPEERVRRRFVNLEGLEYMGEHDDITVGFETEAERDRFAAALPTAATRGRGFTLMRRI